MEKMTCSCRSTRPPFMKGLLYGTVRSDPCQAFMSHALSSSPVRRQQQLLEAGFQPMEVELDGTALRIQRKVSRDVRDSTEKAPNISFPFAISTSTCRMVIADGKSMTLGREWIVSIEPSFDEGFTLTTVHAEHQCWIHFLPKSRDIDAWRYSLAMAQRIGECGCDLETQVKPQAEQNSLRANELDSKDIPSISPALSALGGSFEGYERDVVPSSYTQEPEWSFLKSLSPRPEESQRDEMPFKCTLELSSLQCLSPRTCGSPCDGMPFSCTPVRSPNQCFSPRTPEDSPSPRDWIPLSRTPEGSPVQYLSPRTPEGSPRDELAPLICVGGSLLQTQTTTSPEIVPAGSKPSTQPPPSSFSVRKLSRLNLELCFYKWLQQTMAEGKAHDYVCHVVDLPLQTPQTTTLAEVRAHEAGILQMVCRDDDGTREGGEVKRDGTARRRAKDAGMTRTASEQGSGNEMWKHESVTLQGECGDDEAEVGEEEARREKHGDVCERGDDAGRTRTASEGGGEIDGQEHDEGTVQDEFGDDEAEVGKLLASDLRQISPSTFILCAGDSLQHDIDQLPHHTVRLVITSDCSYASDACVVLERHLPSLEVLQLVDVAFDKITLTYDLTPSLKDLQMQNISHHCDLIIALPCLETVSIHNLDGQDTAINTMLDHASNLESFDSYKLRLQEIHFASNALRKVHLHQSDCLDKLTLWAPKLEKLSLQGCFQLHNITFKTTHSTLAALLPADHVSPPLEVDTTNANLGACARQALRDHPYIVGRRYAGDDVYLGSRYAGYDHRVADLPSQTLQTMTIGQAQKHMEATVREECGNDEGLEAEAVETGVEGKEDAYEGPEDGKITNEEGGGNEICKHVEVTKQEDWGDDKTDTSDPDEGNYDYHIGDLRSRTPQTVTSKEIEKQGKAMGREECGVDTVEEGEEVGLLTVREEVDACTRVEDIGNNYRVSVRENDEGEISNQPGTNHTFCRVLQWDRIASNLAEKKSSYLFFGVKCWQQRCKIVGVKKRLQEISFHPAKLFFKDWKRLCVLRPKSKTACGFENQNGPPSHTCVSRINYHVSRAFNSHSSDYHRLPHIESKPNLTPAADEGGGNIKEVEKQSSEPTRQQPSQMQISPKQTSETTKAHLAKMLPYQNTSTLMRNPHHAGERILHSGLSSGKHFLQTTIHVPYFPSCRKFDSGDLSPVPAKRAVEATLSADFWRAHETVVKCGGDEDDSFSDSSIKCMTSPPGSPLNPKPSGESISDEPSESDVTGISSRGEGLADGHEDEIPHQSRERVGERILVTILPREPHDKTKDSILRHQKLGRDQLATVDDLPDTSPCSPESQNPRRCRRRFNPKHWGLS